MDRKALATLAWSTWPKENKNTNLTVKTELNLSHSWQLKGVWGRPYYSPGYVGGQARMEAHHTHPLLAAR